MPDLNLCPRCGCLFPNDVALGGGCPRCMLELGFETSVGSRERPEQNVAAEHPAVIGRYRILRLIGEGGMGAVYEAEQDHPRRTVALKIIKSGMASPELLRRFEQESQALGRLQHPGIAQIYEAGTVDTGFGPQPYFAMEFIRGRSPRAYAEAKGLNTRDRLQMMVKICEAVHHAHQRGLIHRDLKPGNILVDETGQPKVLDFGVVRVTDSDARATLQTDMGQLIGTLAYMSPEQALTDPLDIDTRSDVYSLGVILYELLSGRLPYTLSKKVHEAIQAIREEDPARLSVSNRTYRGDIETIVSKSLEKERGQRYASAAEMAADIQRYLNDEPIVARPASASYQLQKFARRHKALVVSVAVVFAVLVAAIVTTTSQMMRANRERQNAEAQREQADAARLDASANAASEASQRVLADGARVEAQQNLANAEANLYFNNLGLAHREWMENNIAHATELLKEAPVRLRDWEWHYLSRLVHMEDSAVSTGGSVGALMFSADGTRVISVNHDLTIRTWDAKTFREIAPARHLDNSAARMNATALVLSLDGRMLFAQAPHLDPGPNGTNTVSSETFDVWEIATGRRQLHFISNLWGLTYDAAAFNPSGRFFITSLDRDEFRRLRDFLGVSASRVHAWDIGTDSELTTFGKVTPGASSSGYLNIIHELAFSTDGSQMAVMSDGEISLVNPATSEKRVVLEQSVSSRPFHLTFSHDGTLLVGAQNEALSVWSTADGRERWSYKAGAAVTGLTFSLDDKWIAVGLADFTVRVLDVVNRQERLRLTGHIARITSLAFSPDGARLVSAGDDGQLRVWQLPRPRSVVLDAGQGRVMSVAPALRKHAIFAQVSDMATQRFTLHWWDTLTNRDAAGDWPPFIQTQSFFRRTMSDDNTTLAVADSASVKVIETGTGRILRSLSLTSLSIGPLTDLALSATGRRLAIATKMSGASPSGYRMTPAGTVSVWDVATEKRLVGVDFPDQSVGKVRFSSNGLLFAAAAVSLKNIMTVQLHDAVTGRRLSTISDAEMAVFSPDDRYLAAVTTGSSVTVVDLQTGDVRMLLPRQTGGPLVDMAFNRQNTRLVTVLGDGTVKVWDTESGRQVAELFNSSGPCEIREWRISAASYSSTPTSYSVAFSDNGTAVVLTTTGDSFVRTTTWNGAHRSPH